MQKLGTTTFTDATGTAYAFDVYPLDAELRPAGMVYLVTRRHQADDGSFAYDPIYIGQTADAARHFANHPRRDCFETNEADTLCVFAHEEQGTRQEIEEALVHQYDAPCNKAST